jgi:hypothetical protein
MSHSELGWHSRGYLPHFDGGELAQFITFRLHDALPQSAILRWRDELRSEQPGFAESIMRRRVETYLDQGHGTCYLKDPRVAAIIQDALLFHDGTKYRLAAWTVMPNHVHLLCTPAAGNNLSEIMHSLKSYTSNRLTKSSVAKAVSGRRNISIGTFATYDITRRFWGTSRIIR